MRLAGVLMVVAALTLTCDVRPLSAAGPAPSAARVGICDAQLCQGGTPWFMYGASEYQSNPMTGIDHPAGTIALALRAHLNTIRIVNFYPTSTTDVGIAYSPAQWQKVDRMVARAAAAHLHVLLDLSDYRNLLWNNCIDPYTYDWSAFLKFVTGRRSTVSNASYATDPTIALVAIAGEPLPAGSHTFRDASARSCTIAYGGPDLTAFYARALGQWRSLSRIPVSAGGLGYLAFDSGIDWRAIFSLSANDVCGIKTYGSTIAAVPAVSDFCAGLRKPWIDEEFGWQQSIGDAERAQQFAATISLVRANGGSGELFWNLGFQVKPGTYDIGPATPLAFAAVQAGASAP